MRRVHRGKFVPFCQPRHDFLHREKILFRQDIRSRDRHQFDKADRKLTLSGKMDQRPDFSLIDPSHQHAVQLDARNPRRKSRLNPGMNSGNFPARDLAIEGWYPACPG